MEGKFNIDEQMDALTRGDLSPKQEAQFMNHIQRDPVLKSDYQVNQDIIDGLKETRKAELKARLDAIHIESVLFGGFIGSALVKTGATLIVATSVGIGAYLLLRSESEEQSTIKGVSSKSNLIDLSGTSPSKGPDELLRFDLKGIQDAPVVTSAENKASMIAQKPESSSENLDAPEITMPSVTENFEDEIISSPTLDSSPDLSGTINKQKESISIENKLDGKHSFHYQFYNNKLFLFGDFKGIPYEILEVNGKSGTRTYLNYRDAYYYLKAPSKSIKPLKAIADQELLKELELLKTEKSL